MPFQLLLLTAYGNGESDDPRAGAIDQLLS